MVLSLPLFLVQHEGSAYLVIGTDLGPDTGQEEIRDGATQTDTQRNKKMRETDRHSACLKGCGELSGVEPSLTVSLGLCNTYSC